MIDSMASRTRGPDRLKGGAPYACPIAQSAVWAREDEGQPRGRAEARSAIADRGAPWRAAPRSGPWSQAGSRPDGSVLGLRRWKLDVRGARIPQRPGRRELLPGLEQRLQAGEDHHPAAVELTVGPLAELVVGDGQPAGVLDLLDLPRDPGGSLAFDLVAPQGVEALDEPARRIDLEVLALCDVNARGRGRGLVARAGRPVRVGLDSEAVLGPQLGVGDRLPEAFRGRLDVDLED